MNSHFKIELTQLDRSAQPGRVLVELPDFQVKKERELPLFASEPTLAAVLKALESSKREVNQAAFYESEWEWMQTNKFVIYEKDRFVYARDMYMEVGQALFNCLFGGERSPLYAKYNQKRGEGKEINFEIRFDAEDTLIGALPWELLHDEKDFLIGGGRGTLIRYITFDALPPDWQPPEMLTALVISPKVADVPELRSAELEAVQATQQAGRLSVVPLEKPTLAALETYLRQDSVSLPQVLHFDGHGTFGRQCSSCGWVTNDRKAQNCSAPCGCNQRLADAEPEGYLVFQDENGNADFVSTKRFADLLREAQSSEQVCSRILLVVLSACSSAVARGGESVFNGVAQRLIDARVPAVVATQFTILDGAALQFTKSLYKSIAAGDPLRKAVSWGRTTLGRDPAYGGNQWYRPVLYLRWRDNAGGNLFSRKEKETNLVPPNGPKEKKKYDEFILRIGEDGSLDANLTRHGKPYDTAHGKVSGDDQLLDEIRSGIDDLKTGKFECQEKEIQFFGLKLYRALFPEEVGALFDDAYLSVNASQMAKKDMRWLRVIIEVAPTSEQFWWPLELLYHQKRKLWLASDATFVVFSRRPLLEVKPDEPEDSPLRVLMVISRAKADEAGAAIPCGILTEMGKLVSELPRGMDLKILGQIPGYQDIPGIQYLRRPAEFSELAEVVGEGDWRPHVLHFIGEGVYEETRKKGSLKLVKSDGQTETCSDDLLAHLFRKCKPYVVLLQACPKAAEGTAPAFMSLADRFFEHHIPAVVAMQLSLRDDWATMFALKFYKDLSDGKDVNEAVQSGRQKIWNKTLAMYPDFGTPALLIYDRVTIVTPPIKTPSKTGSGVDILTTGEKRPVSSTIIVRVAINALLKQAEEKSLDQDLIEIHKKVIDGLDWNNHARTAASNGIDYLKVERWDSAQDCFKTALKHLESPSALGKPESGALSGEAGQPPLPATRADQYKQETISLLSKIGGETG